MIRAVLAVVGFSVLAACTNTTKVDLRYKPPASVQPAAQNSAVKVGDFVDSRGENKNWIGTIRGGFGNHLKDLDTIDPVPKVVESAFSDALRARGVNVDSPDARYRLTGVIKTLIGDQVVKREANVVIDVSVNDSRSGQTRFTRSYSGKLIEGSSMSMSTGILASVDDLRVVIENALREAVDKALDDKELRAALQI